MDRLKNEHKTMCAMIKIYCNDHHGTHENVCKECQDLVLYSKKRLDNCPFQEKKPTCGNCTIHCYNKRMRQRAREVMRYAGPRMIWKHPLMAIIHLLDSFRKVPDLKKDTSRRKRPS